MSAYDKGMPLTQGQPWFEVGKEPPSGQLNPVNPELYPILGELYRDMIEFFDPDMIHMGGDDVSILTSFISTVLHIFHIYKGISRHLSHQIINLNVLTTKDFSQVK